MPKVHGGGTQDARCVLACSSARRTKRTSCYKRCHSQKARLYGPSDTAHTILHVASSYGTFTCPSPHHGIAKSTMSAQQNREARFLMAAAMYCLMGA